MIQLPGDFLDFFKLFHSEQVRYLLVGGWAVSMYAEPRHTNDLDVWVGTTPENSAAIVRALRGFGFSQGSIGRDLFTQPNKVFRMGVPPLQIDILTSVTGLDFDTCYKDKVEKEAEPELFVSLLSRSGLMENKRAVGRLKDLADIEALEK